MYLVKESVRVVTMLGLTAQQLVDFRFHFVGTSYVAPGAGTEVVRPLAARFGCAAQVAEVPHRIGHLESLALLRDADALLLPGSPDPAYSPSKAYPYFLSGKPVLGLVYAGSQLEALLTELGGACLAVLPRGEFDPAAVPGLREFFDHACAGFPPGCLPARHEAAFRATYLAEPLTGAQCAWFDRVVAAAGR